VEKNTVAAHKSRGFESGLNIVRNTNDSYSTFNARRSEINNKAVQDDQQAC